MELLLTMKYSVCIRWLICQIMIMILCDAGFHDAPLRGFLYG